MEKAQQEIGGLAAMEAGMVSPQGRAFLDRGILPPILRRTVEVELSSTAGPVLSPAQVAVASEVST